MRNTYLLTSTLILMSGVVSAQDYSFKALEQTYIKGAPQLSQPILLKAGNDYVKVQKNGHAAPALYDWDGDGKLDLLVGEFGGGKKANVMVFKNTGTNKKPVYSAETFYAKDKSGEPLFIDGN